MFIDSQTLKRVNIHAPYAGFSKLDTPEIRERAGVIEIADPVRESDETHYNQEIDEAPYLISTPKPQEQIDAAFNSKVQSQIDSMEQSQLLPRVAREFMKGFYLEKATSVGLTEQQLLDPNSPAYSLAYSKLHTFDSTIASLRSQLRAIPQV